MNDTEMYKNKERRVCLDAGLLSRFSLPKTLQPLGRHLNQTRKTKKKKKIRRVLRDGHF